ncbi:hypothetical protein R5R35_004590 [Gryllus longicercus]|uniref:Uncharacterized protein n=1 Tax=Gryllus longicercus TaxID=2509291 RepID=A0AAN9VYP9_9ORTH
MSKFLRKMEHFDREVEWINKEEKLFKFALSKYPKLDVLRNYIYPFAELLHLVQRWRRALKVWMYGNFEDLSYPDVEEKVEDFYRCSKSLGLK